MTQDRERDVIERAARTLGEAEARAVDAGRVADEVVVALRRETQDRPRPWWRRPSRLVPIAAALALFAGGTMLWQPRGATTAAFVADGAVTLEALEADELGEVLDSLTTEMPVSEFTSVGLLDLDEFELEALLTTLEG